MHFRATRQLRSRFIALDMGNLRYNGRKIPAQVWMTSVCSLAILPRRSRNKENGRKMSLNIGDININDSYVDETLLQ